MRRTRIFSVAVFLLAVVAFFGYHWYRNATTDVEKPQLIMEEKTITVSAAATEEELLSGITVLDDRDGDVSDTLLIEHMGNFTAPGTRIITVAASDRSGNIVKADRQVVYSDYRAPRFELSAPLRFPVGINNILVNMAATDLLDGSLTAQIKISDAFLLNTEIPGDYPMEFSVTNSAGDVVYLPATVTLYNLGEEERRPQLTLSDYIVYLPRNSTPDFWSYLTRATWSSTVYTREMDGVLSAEIRFRHSSPPPSPGRA